MYYSCMYDNNNNKYWSPLSRIRDSNIPLGDQSLLQLFFTISATLQKPKLVCSYWEVYSQIISHCKVHCYIISKKDDPRFGCLVPFNGYQPNQIMLGLVDYFCGCHFHTNNKLRIVIYVQRHRHQRKELQENQKTKNLVCQPACYSIFISRLTIALFIPRCLSCVILLQFQYDPFIFILTTFSDTFFSSGFFYFSSCFWKVLGIVNEAFFELLLLPWEINK